VIIQIDGGLIASNLCS